MSLIIEAFFCIFNQFLLLNYSLCFSGSPRGGGDRGRGGRGSPRGGRGGRGGGGMRGGKSVVVEPHRYDGLSVFLRLFVGTFPRQQA